MRSIKRAVPIAGISPMNNGKAFALRALCMFVINYETLLGYFLVPSSGKESFF